MWLENGHFLVDLGFEYYFTGQAGLMGVGQARRQAAETPEEARLLEVMAWPENLEKYQQETRDNIRALFDWSRRIQQALPVSRMRLWSEGDEEFEEHIEEILDTR
jgi:hypothetical protein